LPSAHTLPTPGEADDGVYHLYALRYAELTGRSIRDNFLEPDMHDGLMSLDYYLWIAHNASRTVVVDTGFSPRAAEERNRPQLVEPIDALIRVGVDPDLIEDVVISHLHYDHAGNLHRFGRARFHVQDAEVGFATGRSMCQAHMRWPFDVEDVVCLVRRTYDGRVVHHRGDADILPGISLHYVPGHTEGMQSVRVITPRGPVVLASDASHLYANILKKAPFSLTLDVDETLKSYDRLLALGGGVDGVIPGHDPKVRKLYPAEVYAGVELHALHRPPAAHRPEDLIVFDDS
jgi:glyoxylase-like metal-dependent hydrolase (beta-lactamase superfamily II)